VTAFELQLQGYRLTTAEIIYRLPDHPALLQSFIWQKFDLAPDYPVLRRFLEFWSTNIEGKLHSVNVRQSSRTGPTRFRHVKHADAALSPDRPGESRDPPFSASGVDKWISAFAGLRRDDGFICCVR